MCHFIFCYLHLSVGMFHPRWLVPGCEFLQPPAVLWSPPEAQTKQPVVLHPVGHQLGCRTPLTPRGQDSFCAFSFHPSVRILADFLPKILGESPFPGRQDESTLQLCSRVCRWPMVGPHPGALARSCWWVSCWPARPGLLLLVTSWAAAAGTGLL